MKLGSKLCIQITVFVLILAVFSFACLYVTAKGYAVKFLQWIMHAGIGGHVVMIGCFVVAALPLPSAFLYGSLVLGAGFIYGVWVGTLSVVLGSFIGLAVALTSFRPCGRKWLEELVLHSKYAAALMRALDHFGIRVIFLLRMSPLPQSLQNAVIALSSVPYSHVMIAASLGALPEQFLGAYIGSTFRDVHELLVHRKHSKVQYIFLVVELVVVVLLFCLISCMAKRALDKLEQEEEAAEESAGRGLMGRHSTSSLEGHGVSIETEAAFGGRQAVGGAEGVGGGSGSRRGRGTKGQEGDKGDYRDYGYDDDQGQGQEHGNEGAAKTSKNGPRNLHYTDQDAVHPQEHQPLLHRIG